jgi:hypothetical protein
MNALYVCLNQLLRRTAGSFTLSTRRSEDRSEDRRDISWSGLQRRPSLNNFTGAGASKGSVPWWTLHGCGVAAVFIYVVVLGSRDDGSSRLRSCRKVTNPVIRLCPPRSLKPPPCASARCHTSRSPRVVLGTISIRVHAGTGLTRLVTI